MQQTTSPRTRTLTRLALASMVCWAATSSVAEASSLPRADFGNRPTFGLGLGNGISLAIDAPIAPLLTLGASLSAPNFSSSNIDVRLMYKLIPGGGINRLTLGLLGGVQAGGNTFGSFNYTDPFVGVGLAYPLTSQITIRGNVAVGILGGVGNRFGPSGAELAYRFSNQLEGTLGFNGRGDVIGLKFAI